MDNKMILIAIAVLAVIAIVVVILLINNNHKTKIKRQVEELRVRFNEIKTIPLAFKLNKAQAMAKRNAETADKVDSYYARFTEVNKHIDEASERFDDLEDDLANKDYKAVEKNLTDIISFIDDLDKEVRGIDEFLEQFSNKENKQRESSASLKEEYREIKMEITENAAKYLNTYPGLEEKLEKIEELFSLSEELMYANDYARASGALENIEAEINELRKVKDILPELIKDVKGVIPVIFDEANRKNDLSKQRGIYLDHLSIDDRLTKAKEELNIINKLLVDGETDNIKEKIEFLKNDLNSILSSLEDENKDFEQTKTIYDQINSNIESIKNLFNYVKVAHDADNDKYNIEDLGSFIENTTKDIDEYSASIISLSLSMSNNDKPSSKLKEELDGLCGKTEQTKTKLIDYKQLIDRNTNDEERAKTQLIKLQVVLNEVEVKVKEYHLPSIASNYKDDLVVGREKINEIKALLEEIPLDIDKLNKTLDEAIDYIYTFYNNVNNIVGMAIMVENAIVFGNKYRSSYRKVESDLSNAEFSYLNGEYTKALTMAISCMETLFPNSANEKILENT